MLSDIHSPADLRRLPVESLPRLCAELRERLIQQLADTPGHLGSSLGVVELTVALHRALDTPQDRIVWDVGHQAYAHKLLTGRQDTFHTIRQLGGLAPFPSPEESEYDTATSGHASTSISMALGMAVAAKRRGTKERAVAVVGDGAMSGGLAFEALNNAREADVDMLIVLNDNAMSISPAVGALGQHLHQLQTSPTYNRLRDKYNLKALTRPIKRLFAHGRGNMFEGLGIRYFGPVDGHDVASLTRTIEQLRDLRGPKLLHVLTTKGKGYAPAEQDPVRFHAPGRCCPETGLPLTSKPDPTVPPLYQDVFGQTLLELARQDERIVAITPAMLLGSGLEEMKQEMPERCFDVGIAEGHAVTFSAGLARGGLRPFCAIYSTFFQRAYDNLIHDVAISGLPVVLCLDRAGLVGEDGATHHGAFDLSALRAIPNIIIASPYNERDLRNLLYTASLTSAPFVIRYPRGRAETADWRTPMQQLPIGKAEKMKSGTHAAVLSLGPIGNAAAEAIKRHEAQTGQTVEHWHFRFLKPIDTDAIGDILARHKRIVTIENGTLRGGLGSAIAEVMAQRGKSEGQTLRMLGLPDRFVAHGTLAELHAQTNTDINAILQALL